MPGITELGARKTTKNNKNEIYNQYIETDDDGDDDRDNDDAPWCFACVCMCMCYVRTIQAFEIRVSIPAHTYNKRAPIALFCYTQINERKKNKNLLRE